MSQITTRELDLVIKELERLNDCFNRLSDRIDSKVESKVDKSTERWKYMLTFGSYAFTMFVLGLVLKMHTGV